MQLLAFRVTKFRNIIDSGPVPVDPSVTCLVGKNEAGKSALLEALYLFNPAYDEAFTVEDQYPRWMVVSDRRAGDITEHAPITVTLRCDDSDLEAIAKTLGDSALTDSTITIKRQYNGKYAWTIAHNDAAIAKHVVGLFPRTLHASFRSCKDLDAVHSTLKELSTLSEDGAPSKEDLSAATTALKERQLTAISARSAIVNILTPRLPKFFHFTSYSTLPGRIDFREIASSKSKEEGPGRSSLQTARALLQLAGTDLSQLGNENYELRKSELEAVQIDLTNQVFEFWKQNPALEVLIDVDKATVQQPNGQTAVSRYLDIRLRDKRTGYSNNFAQRSSGFQWFFSFLAAFSAFKDQQSPIVLLDEPGLTLHGRAQADFLNFINKRLAPLSPVLYTTHSPFMVEPGRLDAVRVVEDQGPPIGATATDQVLAHDADSLFPLQAALGYDIAQSLFIGPNNLVVEGTSDFIYLTVMSLLCGAAGLSTLDPRWRIIPAGSAANIPTFVSLIGPHLDITVLADSDTRGLQRVANMAAQNLLDGRRLILAHQVLKVPHADIEDFFTEEDYLKLYNRAHNATLKVADLPPGDRIIKRIQAHIGAAFDHGQVAETLLRHHGEMNLADTTLTRFATLYEAINTTFALKP
jgi:predicted ATP-dependent endonuclease of OLD family